MSGPSRRGAPRNTVAPSAHPNAQKDDKPRAPRPPKIDPYADLPPFPPHGKQPVVYYARTAADADRIAAYLVKTGGPIGFDVEWRPNYTAGLVDNQIALVQVASQHVVLLAQVIYMTEFPTVLRELLESTDIVKTGVGIQSDVVKLYNDYRVVTRNCVDLASLALTIDPLRWVAPPPPPQPENPQSENQKETAASKSKADNLSREGTAKSKPTTSPNQNGTVDPTKKKRPKEPRPPRDPNAPPPLSTPGLARLTGTYIQLRLDKPKKVQRSNWELNLSREQQQYAANDATAGYEIYKALKAFAATLTRPETPDPRSPQFFSFDVYAGNIFFRADDAYGVDTALEHPADALDVLPLPAPISTISTLTTPTQVILSEFRPIAQRVPQPDVFPQMVSSATNASAATASGVGSPPNPTRGTSHSTWRGQKRGSGPTNRSTPSDTGAREDSLQSGQHTTNTATRGTRGWRRGGNPTNTNGAYRGNRR